MKFLRSWTYAKKTIVPILYEYAEVNVSSITIGGTGGVSAFRTAFLLSAFGYEFLFFAMTLRVYDITGKAFNVGIFAALTFLPKLLSPVYGALVDRFGARAILRGSSASIAVLTVLLGYADGIALLYSIWFALAVLFMAVSNARTVLMTETEISGGLLRGNALVLSFLNTARLVSPLGAALALRFFGPRQLVFAVACVYLLCSASSLMISGTKREKIAAPPRGNVFGIFLDGFSTLRHTKTLRTMIVIGVIWRLFLGMQTNLLIVLVTRVLGRSNADYGVALTVAAICSLAGSIAGPPIVAGTKPKYVAAAGLGLCFACFGALGVITNFAIALAALGLGHFSLYAAVIALHVKRDDATKGTPRGSIYGATTATLTVPAMLSMAAGGALADSFGVPIVFAAAGTAALICLAAVCAKGARFSPIPHH